MTFSYSGPALLVYPDGTTAELERVDLIETVTGGVREWSGAVKASAALHDGEARLRLAIGGEADVLVTNVRVSTGAGRVSATATLLGRQA